MMTMILLLLAWQDLNEPFILIAQERKIITKSNNNVAVNYKNKIIPSGSEKA